MVIQQTVSDRKNITTADTLKVAYWLMNGVFQFDLDLFKGQSQGHTNVDCEYLVNGERQDKCCQ